MKTFALIMLSTLCFSAQAQEFPFWGKLKSGNYEVGYEDTILYNNEMQYRYHNYQGGKPYFIGVWYPAQNNRRSSYLKFSDYLGSGAHANVGVVWDSLLAKYDEVYVRDAIAKSIRDMKPKDTVFSESLKQLFRDVKETKVNARRGLKKAKGEFPVIYYHHGAQSSAFDNVVFCEYMASQGYVVITSNYLWPLEGKGFLGEGRKELADIAFVLEATKPLVSKNTPFLIGAGHSWGAQAMIMFDTLSQKPFKQIIAFHTTLEDKPVDLAAKHWSDLMHAFQKNNTLMTTPTVVMAPEFRINKGFDFLTFRENKTTPYTFVTVKTSYITHDGFVTLGNLRAPFAKKYALDDQKELELQQGFYEQIVILARLLMQDPVDLNRLSPELKQTFDVRRVNK